MDDSRITRLKRHACLMIHGYKTQERTNRQTTESKASGQPLKKVTNVLATEIKQNVGDHDAKIT